MKLKQAMLLAAGFGHRLLPLTSTTAKPLLLFQGKPLIVHHLERLRQLNIEKVIVNVHHLADQIMQALGDGSAWGLQIEYSLEEKLLGPGGAVRQVLHRLSPDPFLFISGDIYTDFAFEKFFMPDWSLKENLIHCVVTDKAKDQKGDFNLENGKLVLAEHPQFVYGSIAVIDPKAFSDQSLGHSGIMPAFSKVIDQERAGGEYCVNILNINTIDDYKKGQL
jgi:MurNAc alpha-1-phosphate uridylyltransferase